MKKIIILLIIFSVFFSSSLLSGKKEHQKKYIIAYIFVKDRLIKPESVAVEKLTHINYAFSNIQDGKIIKGFKNDRENFKILNNLKKRNPELKILSSVGGWTWSGNFSDMALTKKSRAKFNESVVEFIKKYNLDGIDIDWEFPGLIGYGNKHRPEDKQNFTFLLKELRKKLDQETVKTKKKYLLTIACGGFLDFIKHSEMDKVQKYCDFINIMAYDLYESEVDKITGHHSALFTNPKDPKGASADQAITDYVKAGVPVHKLVLGVPFYGRSWGKVNPVNNGLYQSGGEARIRTSFKAFKEIHEKNKNFQYHWDSTSKTSYLWNPVKKIFISFNDVKTMKAKSRYILKKNLKGAMFWEYSSDYKNQLLTALFNGLIKKAGK